MITQKGVFITRFFTGHYERVCQEQDTISLVDWCNCLNVPDVKEVLKREPYWKMWDDSHCDPMKDILTHHDLTYIPFREMEEFIHEKLY